MRKISWCVNFRFFMGNVKTTKIYTLNYCNNFWQSVNDGAIKVAMYVVRYRAIASHLKLLQLNSYTSRFYASDHGWLIAITMIFLTSHSNGESAGSEAQTLANMSPSSKAARNPLDTWWPSHKTTTSIITWRKYTIRIESESSKI